MRKKLLFIPLFLLIIEGCKKTATMSVVPNESVYFTADISYPPYTNLQNVGGWVYVANKGYDGIILYRSSPNTILAYDRGCPYDCATNKLAIDTVDRVGGIIAECPVCYTTYTLPAGGAVASGPGTLALKQYYTTYYHPLLTVSSNPL
jgi:hypothetical protein